MKSYLAPSNAIVTFKFIDFQPQICQKMDPHEFRGAYGALSRVGFCEKYAIKTVATDRAISKRDVYAQL
ncbi:hypothetical protein [Candidatus Epulonipiscium viviparus]|uniref:hypothetical protein n=1 Tax=Candidatus Epulonipiscium viviparus TaxID=420336 RepID=UPI0027380B4F|nr:hypothetical protein [Candidatus Epulopiscium viviparus]